MPRTRDEREVHDTPFLRRGTQQLLLSNAPHSFAYRFSPWDTSSVASFHEFGRLLLDEVPIVASSQVLKNALRCGASASCGERSSHSLARTSGFRRAELRALRHSCRNQCPRSRAVQKVFSSLILSPLLPHLFRFSFYSYKCRSFPLVR